MKKRAYVVDDDDVFVFLFKKILEESQQFSSINHFYNGEKALTVLIENYQKNDIPDVIFLDINMPVMDGWQFLDQVEKLPFKQKLSIYIISSSIDYVEIERAKKYKTVKDFISKPISKDSLSFLK